MPSWHSVIYDRASAYSSVSRIGLWAHAMACARLKGELGRFTALTGRLSLGCPTCTYGQCSSACVICACKRSFSRI